MALLRYNDDGTLDTSFNGGVILYNEGGGYRFAGYDITLDKYGNIYVVGNKVRGDEGNIAIWKYDSNGNKVWGPVIYDSGGYDAGNGIEIDTCGRIIVTGVADGRLVVLRYGNDGMPDLTFGKGTHIIRYNGISGYTEGKRIGVYNEYGIIPSNYGKIVITGEAYMEERGMDMAVIRYVDNCEVCIPALTPTPTSTP